jgi:hypothetical protein
MTSEQALRRMRQRIWDYDGTPNEAKAERVLLYLKKRMLRNRKVEVDVVGPYSGLTRSELAKTGTCEPDWF